jgi:hypothetical protein
MNKLWKKLLSKISSFIIMTGQERNKWGAHFLWTNFWNKNVTKKYSSSMIDNFKYLKLLEMFPVSALYSLKA